MNFAWRIGRWRGIEVRVHWTLLAYALVVLVLPWPADGTDVGLRLATIGLLFGSVLLHEFGHAFAARFCDGRAEQILLWPLGGLAMVSVPAAPSARFLTALAGPLVSLALWGAATVVGQFMPGWAWHELAAVNLMMFLFNLLPAFPLDGGQLLHAVLWRRYGPSRAMWYCAHLGIAIAVLLFLGSLVATDVRQLSLSLTAVAAFIFYEAWKERQFLLIEFQNTAFWSSRPGVAYNHPYRSASRPAPEEEEPMAMSEEDFMREKVDPILDKISREGMQSLTRRERKILESARDLMQKQRR